MVRRGDEQHPGLGDQHRAGGDVRLPHRGFRHLEVDLLATQPAERVGQRQGLHLDPYLRVDLAELLRHPQQQMPGERRGEADAQGAGDPPGGCCRPRDLLLDGPVRRSDAHVEPLADGGQRDPAAGAVEQPGADAPLQAGDRLADAPLGHSHPLRRAAEMQLLGQREEDLHFLSFHCPTSDH